MFNPFPAISPVEDWRLFALKISPLNAPWENAMCFSANCRIVRRMGGGEVCDEMLTDEASFATMLLKWGMLFLKK